MTAKRVGTGERRYGKERRISERRGRGSRSIQITRRNKIGKTTESAIGNAYSIFENVPLSRSGGHR